MSFGEKVMEVQSCLIGNREFVKGAQVCEETMCYVCRDGIWKERFIDLVYGAGP